MGDFIKKWASAPAHHHRKRVILDGAEYGEEFIAIEGLRGEGL
jgi:hypothetical protein